MKKCIVKTLLLLTLLLIPFQASADLNINPSNQDELLSILKSLANDHSYKQWCEINCGQIHELSFSGKIADGTLVITIKGHLIGKQNGVLPLFGATPAIDIISLKNGLHEVPLVFYNKSFYTFLAPGPFILTGQIRINNQTSTNVTLPGPVGKVMLNIADQEPLLLKIKQGQIGGSFQLVSASQRTNKEKTEQGKEHNLRLQIKKHFKVARDKNFIYDIKAVGATSGQVITFPLTQEEKILEVKPATAKVHKDKVVFTATGSENFFSLQGEWTQDDIKLLAPSGAIQETWSIDCQGAYDCLFDGKVEKSLTARGHEWLPIEGQTLTVTWNELGLLKGQSLVAQTAQLGSVFAGDGLKQNLKLDVTSSAATQFYLDLPTNAIPTKLKYDNNISPILKNEEGKIHLSIPKGNSQINLAWEIQNLSTNKIPLPKLNLPTGRWVFDVTPNKNESAIYTSGPAGSPVVMFWPRLLFSLFIGLLFLLTEKRLLQKVKTKLFLFLIMCAGYALTGPTGILSAIMFIALIRWFNTVKKQRNIMGWLLEWGLLVTTLMCVLATFFYLLNTAFFSNTPLPLENFCSSSYATICWETALTQQAVMPQAPFILTIPTLAIRIFYFIWTLLVGYFFFTEFKNLWRGLKHYSSIGMKPLFNKPKKDKGTK